MFGFALSSLICSLSFANPSFLSADKAFQLSSESISKNTVQLKWTIAPHYYLYHDQFVVKSVHHDKQKKIDLKLPQGQKKNDPTFGLTEVHYDQVQVEFKVQPETTYKIQWQGCSQDGLCYPLQHQTIHTDLEGLIPQSHSINTLNTITSDPLSNAIEPSNNTQLNTESAFNTAAINKDLSTNNLAINRNTKSENEISTSLQWNDDQSFFNLLSKDSLVFNLLIFFALGILLAFLPCSLPLIPILSTLIIQRRSGLRAAAVAASFILSMAMVYSIMGIVVAEIGYSFQRWFQSPIVLSLFATLFIVFALNLFGLFNLSLPSILTQKLNQFQNKQKAGTFLGTITMGALSALIIGPCMSAPLAGALLFVSQSHSAVLGGLYLFILGLGLGLPLFIASVFGSRLLPKPGIWMNHLKVCFGFMMLAMAIYFIQPLLSSSWYTALMGLISLFVAIYFIRILLQANTWSLKIISTVLIITAFSSSAWHIKQSYHYSQIQHSEMNQLDWTRVSTADELAQALTHAQKIGQHAIIDVYADWCVACQPIEKEVFPRADVQLALQDIYLIKLDLSTYNASQDLILKQHEILGPPTLLFIDQQGHEVRHLRLTGTFKADILLEKISQLSINQ